MKIVSFMMVFITFFYTIGFLIAEIVMPNYCMTYLGGNQPDNEQANREHFGKYMAWMMDLQKRNILRSMNPLKDMNTVESDGSISEGGRTQMSGFSIIETDTMESALEIAKSCPFLEIKGSIEVSELLDMTKD